ncbi:hypothetical protein [Hyphomonas sp.]|uniref:hypothetical protein n=1 Tax=Hyphomonas sp. TaxID=87 RepID=UPI0025B99358|nr:hypothetical protein [Hyphomonas sp.]
MSGLPVRSGRAGRCQSVCLIAANFEVLEGEVNPFREVTPPPVDAPRLDLPGIAA